MIPTKMVVMYSDSVEQVFQLRDSIVISEEYVTALFKTTNMRKAAGHDRICGRTLCFCADQLGGIYSPFSFSCVLTTVNCPLSGNKIYNNSHSKIKKPKIIK